jgi:hypothetical protein
MNAICWGKNNNSLNWNKSKTSKRRPRMASGTIKIKDHENVNIS